VANFGDHFTLKEILAPTWTSPHFDLPIRSHRVHNIATGEKTI
jgi:hypothetical protein